MNWQTPLDGLFSNDWVAWIFSAYSLFMMWLVSVVGALLKIIAIRHPGVPTNAIMDLIKVIFKNPGATDEDKTRKEGEL